MRVLFWSETFWPRVGGVERLATSLLAALRARHREFAVVTWVEPHAAGQDSFDGIPVYRLPFFDGSASSGVATVMAHVAAVAALKREFAPDLVHVNSFGRSAWFHLNTAGAADAPTLVTLHQPLTAADVAPDSIGARLFARAAWVACCSDAVLRSVRRLVPSVASRASVVANALPHDASAPPVGPPPMSPRLLFVGRLVEEKGLDLLIDALPTLVARVPAATLTVAGDGPLRAGLERRARVLGVAPRIAFVGAQAPAAVTALIDEATAVIVPSRVEGFGLVALEAAMRGRAVVATRVGGLPEVVRDGVTGFLVVPGDAAALASAAARLIDDPALAARLGAAGRAHARTAFAWDRHVDAYDELYAHAGALTASAR